MALHRHLAHLSLGLVKALVEDAEWRNLKEQRAVVLLLCLGAIPGI